MSSNLGTSVVNLPTSLLQGTRVILSGMKQRKLQSVDLLKSALNKTWSLNGRRGTQTQNCVDGSVLDEPPSAPRSLRTVRVSDESARELQQILSDMPGGHAVTLEEAREAGQRLVSFTYLVRDLRHEASCEEKNA